jgi:uncharacterized membrane protein YeaQ/YmgE (transglycosylase-associated protein family)
MNFILWLLFGALVGWLASLLMRTNARQGALMNIIVGIVGAMIGGWIFNRDVDPSIFRLSSMVTAFIGAVILLGIYNLVTAGRVR